VTIDEAIETLDRLVVNQLPRSDKVRWLSRLDSWLFDTVTATHQVPEAPSAFEPYDDNTPGDRELLAPLPCEELYRWYLELQVHSANGESGRYNEAAAKYNAALQEYLNAMNRAYPPKGERVKYW